MAFSFGECESGASLFDGKSVTYFRVTFWIVTNIFADQLNTDFPITDGLILRQAPIEFVG